MAQLAHRVGETTLFGRTGGAPSLALGMAQIFGGVFRNEALLSFWYHFAIMFEALFILTTIDTGTRIGRFLVQEVLGKLWRPLGDLDGLGPAVLATALVVCGWSYFILTGSVETIWPMFGVANQLLAVIALAVVTTILVNSGRGRYAWATLLPMAFVATTTTTIITRTGTAISTDTTTGTTMDLAATTMRPRASGAPSPSARR